MDTPLTPSVAEKQEERIKMYRSFRDFKHRILVSTDSESPSPPPPSPMSTLTPDHPTMLQSGAAASTSSASTSW